MARISVSFRVIPHHTPHNLDLASVPPAPHLRNDEMIQDKTNHLKCSQKSLKMRVTEMLSSAGGGQMPVLVAIQADPAGGPAQPNLPNPR